MRADDRAQVGVVEGDREWAYRLVPTGFFELGGSE